MTSLAGSANAQDRFAPIKALLESTVAADAPGVALGVVQEGRIVFVGYRGMENLETVTPVGPETRFNIASNAKSFTALTVLDLARSGQLSLDDDARRYAPEALRGMQTPITVSQLISHTSGLRDVYDLWSLEGRTWWQTFVGNADALALLSRQTALNFEPGSAHLYSNSNYILLTQVVAAASGKTFADQSAALFARWGLENTAFATDAARPIPHRARPYSDFGSGWIEFPAITSIHGDGWLFTTLDDQLAFEARVQGGQDALLVAAQEAVWPTYGFGLEHSGSPGARHIWHDGSTGAYNASLSRFPDCGLSIVAMSNNGQASTRTLVTQVADILLEGCASAAARFPERLDGARLAVDDTDLPGLYRQTNGGADIGIVLTEDGLRREIEGREPVRLITEGPGTFRYESNPDLRMAFDRTPEGLARLTILAAFQPPAEAVRYPEAPPGSFQGWTGRYINAETGARLDVELVDDAPTMMLNGEAAPVRVLSADAVSTSGYVVRRGRAEAGRVQTLLLDGGRVRAVRFDRVTGED